MKISAQRVKISQRSSYHMTGKGHVDLVLQTVIEEGFFELRSEGCEEGRMKFSESALAERKKALPI